MTCAPDRAAGAPRIGTAPESETVPTEDLLRADKAEAIGPWSRWSRSSGDAARDAARAEIKRLLETPELQQMSSRLAASDRTASANEEPSTNMARVCTPRESSDPAWSTAPGESARSIPPTRSFGQPRTDEVTRSRRNVESADSAEEFETRMRRAFRRGCMVGILPSFLALFLLFSGEDYPNAEMSLTDDGSVTADRLTIAAVDASAASAPHSAHRTGPSAEANAVSASFDPHSYAEALPRPDSSGGQGVDATGTLPNSSVERDFAISETVSQPTWSPPHGTDGTVSTRLTGVPDKTGESPVAEATPPQGHFLPEETPADRVDTRPDPALESSQPARIVVHYKDAEKAAVDLVEVLQTLGFARSELRRVPHRIENSNVRFFHEQNRRVAEDVSDILRAMGSRSEVRDFTHHAPVPSVGTIEVWLNG